MESDVSEVPPYVSHAPFPLKKRYALWNTESVTPANTHLLSGFMSERNKAHQSQMYSKRSSFSSQSPPAEFLPGGSRRYNSMQFPKRPRSLARFGPGQNQEEASSSLERELSIGQMIAACDAEKERLLREASRLEEAEIKRRNAKEWILQNNAKVQHFDPGEDDEDANGEEDDRNAEEIYLQINGKKYVARPVETSEDNRGKRKYPQRSSAGDIPSRRKNCQDFRSTYQKVNEVPISVDQELQNRLSSFGTEESLEEVIMKDKLLMLSQLKQLNADNMVYVSIDAEKSTEAFNDVQPTLGRSNPADEVNVLLRDRCRSPHSQIMKNVPPSTASPSTLTGYYLLPPSGTSTQKLSVTTNFHKQSRSKGGNCSSLVQSPNPSPVGLSLPMSPGSVSSSAENFANTRCGSPVSSESASESCGDSSTKSGHVSTAWHSTAGSSQTCEATNGQESSSVSLDVSQIKKEPDTQLIESPSVKRPSNNKCPICSDEISGYHYGIYSCESCKGFFKRTVQNKRNERLRCPRNKTCEITLESRKHCAACRFQKCIDQGMKLEAIRGDRQRGGRSMYEGSSEYRRRQMLQVQQQSSSTSQPVTKRRKRQNSSGNGKLREILNSRVSPKKEDLIDPKQRGPKTEFRESEKEHPPDRTSQFIEEIVVHNAFLEAQPLATCCQISGLSEDMIFRSICHLVDHHLGFLFEWAQGLPYFRELEKQDQDLLYRNRWIQLMLTHYCLSISENPGIVCTYSGQVIDLKECLKSATFIDFVRRLRDITGIFKSLKMDAVECAILKLLVLLDSDVAINQPTRITHFQEKVQDALFEYVLSRNTGNVRRVGDMFLRFAEIEKLCHVVYEHFMFQFMAGHLSEYSHLCEVLAIR